MSVHIASTFLTLLGTLERKACVAALIFLAIVLFSDVLLRTLMGNGLAWSLQSGVYANIVVSLVGLGLASANGSHLRPRFADHLLPDRWEPIILRLQPLVSAIVFFLFACLAVQLVMESIELGERSTVLQSLVWPIQCLLPLVFGLAAIRYVLFALYPSLQPDQVVDIEVEDLKK